MDMQANLRFIALTISAIFSVLPAQAADERVAIVRDRFGVPHIRAATEIDGFYGLGWAEAEDGLEGLLAEFLAAEGHSARIYGRGNLPWGEPAAETDRAALMFRHAEESKAALAGMSERTRKQQEAFVAGMRDFMKAHPEKVPNWAPKVEAWHPLALTRSLLWFFNVNDALKACAAGGVRVAPLATPPKQSNAWVVSGRRTADGRTLVLSDPHGDVNGAPFYEFVMEAGDLRASGYAVGSAIMLGQTPDVAWGLTTGGPAVSDCYRLGVAADGTYRIHGERKRLTDRNASIAIKDSPDVPVHFEYAEVNGVPAPVIAHNATDAYVVVTPYFHGAGDLHIETDRMIHAHNTAEVLKADEVHGLFPQNLIVGDRFGAIAWLRAGRTPIRDQAVDRRLPLAGDDPRTKWRGIHPYTDLVSIKDPPEGFLQNDNYPPLNFPEVVNHQPAYPAYIINDDPTEQTLTRGDRITALLRKTAKPTLEDAKSFSLDEYWSGSENWTALLAQAIAQRHVRIDRLPNAQAAMARRLLAFDGYAHADSVAALDSYYWRGALWSLLAPAERDLIVQVVTGKQAQSDPIAAKVVAALDVATITMEAELGKTGLAFGDVFRMGRGDRDFPVGGGMPMAVDAGMCHAMRTRAGLCVQTERAYGFATSGAHRRAIHGSRALRLVALGDTTSIFSQHNFGQSEDPASPHYLDQAERLVSPGKLKEVRFGLGDKDPDVESIEYLNPH